MQTQTKPAPATERTTDHDLTAVHDGGKECGVEECAHTAALGVRCMICGMALCTDHAWPRYIDGFRRIVCPERKGGA